MRTYILTFCLISSVSLTSCGQNRFVLAYKKLSKPERRWVTRNLRHSKKAYALSMQAREATRALAKLHVMDADTNGGQLDAFRHAYWMALAAKQLGYRRAIKLGEAHEAGNRDDFERLKSEEGMLPDSMASVMDLYNNVQGASIGKQHKQQPDSVLAAIVQARIVAGDMRILWKNELGEVVDCQGNPLNTALYKGKWHIPKCLVASNRKRAVVKP